MITASARAPLRGLRVAANRRRLLAAPFALVVFTSFLFLVRLGHRELYTSHEARAAQNAQRMLDTGEWGLPVLFDGQADLQKPPGYYWLVAAAGYLNGGTVTAFEARLPAAIAGLFTVLMVFGFLRGEGRPIAAWVAAIALATSVHFTAISRTARIDVPLACAVTAALICFYRSLNAKPQKAAWVLLSAMAAAIGVMLKGPIALALVGPTAVVWLLIRPTDGNRWALPISSLLLGTITVFAVTAPWFIWVNHTTNGEFFQVFFWHHNVERFAGSSPTLASHPWWYYAPRFAADFLPWTPALTLLVAWARFSPARRASKGEPQPSLERRAGENDSFRFGLVWFLTMFLVLSTAHFKRADYLLPLFPGAAIALGCAAETWLTSRSPRTVLVSKWLFGIAAASTLIGWQVMSFVVEPAEQAKEEKRAFAEAIRSQAADHEVMLFRAESHLLAFRLGRPLLTRVEWHDLNDWASAPGPHFVVMPPEYAEFAQHIVRSRKLVEVARLADYTADRPPRPLVFLRVE